MKKTSTLRFLLLAFCICAFSVFTANAQVCAWARSGGGVMDAKAVGVVTHAAGNVYVTGWYDSDSMYFGTTAIVNTDSVSTNIYLAKYDSTGNLLWAKSFGGSDADNASGMAIDLSGNIYITGTLHSSSATFGAITIANPTNESVFLAKIDGAGTVLWAKNAATTADAMIEGLAVTTDLTGNIFVTGFFSDSIHFDSAVLVHTLLGNGIFVAKYNALGDNIWATASNGAGDDEPAGIAVDASDNVYVTGTWTSTDITFGSITLTNSNTDNNLFFLAKYDPSGIPLWAKSAGDSNFVGSNAIGLDAAGNVYAAGIFSSPTLTFGGATLTNADPSGSTDDVFLVKYTNAGSLVWTKGFGGSGEDDCYSMYVNADGSFYTGGLYASPSLTIGTTTLSNFGLFLAQFNSSGDGLWAKGAAGFSIGGATSVCKDAYGHLYATGIFNSPTLTLDANTLTDPASPFNDMFVARYDNVSEGVRVLAVAPVLVIYPNPATNVLDISSVENINTVFINDVTGRTLFTQVDYNMQHAAVDISSLPAGVYFVQVNGSEAREFVKR